MALGPASSPVSLDFTTGEVGIFSTTYSEVGIYSWVITVSYQTAAGGLLATSTLNLVVEIKMVIEFINIELGETF